MSESVFLLMTTRCDDEQQDRYSAVTLVVVDWPSGYRKRMTKTKTMTGTDGEFMTNRGIY